MFRDQTSELFTSFRNPAMNDGTGSLPESDVDYSNAFNEGNFTVASSSIEGTPHGAVHVDVGGAEGWMGSVPTAAQGPIFISIIRTWIVFGIYGWLKVAAGRTQLTTVIGRAGSSSFSMKTAKRLR